MVSYHNCIAVLDSLLQERWQVVVLPGTSLFNSYFKDAAWCVRIYYIPIHPCFSQSSPRQSGRASATKARVQSLPWQQLLAQSRFRGYEVT